MKAQPLVWVCWDCPARFPQNDLTHRQMSRVAIAHCEDEDHWLGEHPNGYRGNAPTRTMHASDAGGVYTDLLTPEEGERHAREWRDKQPGGAF